MNKVLISYSIFQVNCIFIQVLYCNVVNALRYNYYLSKKKNQNQQYYKTKKKRNITTKIYPKLYEQTINKKSGHTQ